MILKSLREKSNKKFVEELLNSRGATVNQNKVKSIGVLLHQKEFDDPEAFRSFFKELGLNSPKHKVCFFLEEESVLSNPWEISYNKKDFGWSGQLKNKDLEQFVSEPFDVIIGYYNEHLIELDQIIAMSSANLKVGVHGHDQRLFDLIFDISVIRFDLFKEEFRKYLTILNKL